jgi:hypothetical protein
MELPVAKVKVIEGRTVYLLKVVCCPFCKGVHKHGGGNIKGELILGNRLAHCDVQGMIDKEEKQLEKRLKPKYKKETLDEYWEEMRKGINDIKQKWEKTNLQYSLEKI